MDTVATSTPSRATTAGAPRGPTCSLLDVPGRAERGGRAARGTRAPCVHGDGSCGPTRSCASAGRVARVLVEAMGLEPGQRACCCTRRTRPRRSPRGSGSCCAGGIVVATMPLLRAGEIAKVVAKAQVTHALVARRARGRGRPGAGVEPVLETVRPFSAVEGRDAAFDAGRHGAPTTSRSSPSPPARPGSRRAACTSTATCSRRATRSAATCSHPQPDDVFAGTPPLAFTFGLGGHVLFPLRFGASTAPCAKPGPERCSSAIARARRHDAVHRADRLPGAAASAGAPSALDSLRACVSRGRAAAGGACRTRGSRAPASASSTGSARPRCCTSSSPRRPEDARAGSCGHRRCPGYEARIVDEDMQTLPAGRGRPARRARRRPAAATSTTRASRPTSSTAGTSPATRSRMDDGRLLLVPGAHRRHDHLLGLQHLGLRGRGRAARAPGRRASARSSPSPDEERGHVVKAFVVVASGATVEPRWCELQDHVKARIAPYKYPRRIEFLDALPRTPTGKVQRNVLRGARIQREAPAAAGLAASRAATPTASRAPRAGSCSSPARSAGTRPARSSPDLAGQVGQALRTSSPCWPRPAPAPSTSRA